MGATASDRDNRGTQSVSVSQSPTSPDVTGTNVPTTSTTAHPVDQVLGRKVVTIGTIPESSAMLQVIQDPSLGLCSAQTSGSLVTLISANAAATAVASQRWVTQSRSVYTQTSRDLDETSRDLERPDVGEQQWQEGGGRGAAGEGRDTIQRSCVGVRSDPDTRGRRNPYGQARGQPS